jgi:hypothetical protein
MDKEVRTDNIELQSYLWNLLTVNKKIIFSYLENKDESKLINEMFNNEENGKLLKKAKYFDFILGNLSKTQSILDYFVKLGYVDKKEDNFYLINYSIEAYYYRPFITPNGTVDLPGLLTSNCITILLGSEEYYKFLREAADFKSRIESGLYHTLFSFTYKIIKEFSSLVYELKNKYFDSIYFFGPKDCKLVAPLNIPNNASDTKNWRPLTLEIDGIEQITFDDFYNKDIIDNRIDNIKWKKDRDGMIVFKGRAYWLRKDGEYENFHDFYDRNILGIPNFLDRGIFSIENYMSRIYEDSVAQYLHMKHGYSTKTRYKPQYLDGKEIDVFAEKLTPRTFTVCECKLRLNDKPIIDVEITSFANKKDLIIKNEKRNLDDRFHFWFITNTKKIPEEIKELAKRNKIDLKLGELPSNWKTRADWSINVKSSF